MKAFFRAVLVLPIFFTVASFAQETSLTGSFGESQARSKFGMSYFNFTGAGWEAAEHGFPELSIYNYVSFHYKYDKDQRFSIRPAFQIYTSGYDKYGVRKKGDYALSDLHLNYSNYSLALLPGDWEVSGQLKLYFPTSESTQEKKIITYLKGEIISQKILRQGWTLQYTAKPAYYFHSQRAFRDENTFERNDGTMVSEVKPKTNKWGELNHYFGVGKYLNSVFTPKLEVGFVHEGYYTSEYAAGFDSSSNKLKIAPNTEIHATRKLWFVFGIETTAELNDSRIAANDWQDSRGRSIKLFQPENTQYYLMTFLSL